MSNFYFPARALHTGHPPMWTWIFLWPIWAMVYLAWLVGLAVLFVVLLPVNVVRARR